MSGAATGPRGFAPRSVTAEERLPAFASLSSTYTRLAPYATEKPRAAELLLACIRGVLNGGPQQNGGADAAEFRVSGFRPECLDSVDSDEAT